MNTLGVIAFAIAIAGAAASWLPGCAFDEKYWCEFKCPWDNTKSWLQFAVNPCDHQKFIMCEKDIFGNVHTHNFTCDPCMHFSEITWACSIKISDDNCPTNPPPIIVPIENQVAYTNCFCVDFDGDAREKNYYTTADSCYPVWVPWGYVDSYWATGRGIASNGNDCHVEVPYFQNNQFRTFALCGMFYPFWGTSGTRMGLAFDGWNDDCAPGSIQIFKGTDDYVYGEVRLVSHDWFTVRSDVPVAQAMWHKVCLIYNGNGNTRTLTLTLDNRNPVVLHNSGLVGLTAAEHCNMRYGMGKDHIPWRRPYGFRGFLDTWCFSDNLLRRDQCASGIRVEPPIQTE